MVQVPGSTSLQVGDPDCIHAAKPRLLAAFRQVNQYMENLSLLSNKYIFKSF